MWPRLRGELSQNPRLRFALVVLVCIALWNIAMLSRSAAQQAEARWRQADTALARAAQDAATSEWPTRVAQARAIKAQVQASLWRQPTLGLAQVRLEEWVRSELEIVGIQPRFVGPVVTGASVAGIAAAEGSSGIVPIRVRFDAEFNGAKLDRFLVRLQSASPKVYVTQLNARPDATQRVEGVVVAHFVNPELPK
jgi:hypothetical protein